MSEIKVNKISQRSGTAITLGNSGTDFQLPSGADIVAQSGSTITIASGATITNNGTATGFGATGAVNWDTTPKTTTVTAVSGVGYFVDATSGGVTVNLPAGTAGSIVAVSDYANISATNLITITPNGTNKIDGVNASYYLATNGAAITFVYVDSTRGWKDINDATLNAVGALPAYVAATGGTITTCGNFKIHTFTGPGTFTVTCAGNVAGSNKVDYLVVAGGGGGGLNGGGAGAGGFRYSNSTFSVPGAPGAPLASSTGLPVSVTGYPITVGSGGSGSPFGAGGPAVTSGNPSVFSTITSAGGGFGGLSAPTRTAEGNPGGSGGGGHSTGAAGAAGHGSYGSGGGGGGNSSGVGGTAGNGGNGGDGLVVIGAF